MEYRKARGIRPTERKPVPSNDAWNFFFKKIEIKE